MTLQEVAAKLTSEGIFTGGPPELFESGGRMQMVTLLNEGLLPESRVLDVGCGCLRAGYWLVRFLNPGCYFGIEPNKPMLDRGAEYLLGPEVITAKRPRFDHNDRFDFSVFGVKFDAVVARSIWTHTSKAQISGMLDNFVSASTRHGFLLASYLPASRFGLSNRDYKGESWIGRSHKSTSPGLAHHSLRWIQKECEHRGLQVVPLRYGLFNNQRWLKISVKSSAQQSLIQF